MWENPVQSPIIKNVFRDSDTFPMIPLVALTATNHEHFGILLFLIFEKRSTANIKDINKNIFEVHTLLLIVILENGLKTSFLKQVRN